MENRLLELLYGVDVPRIMQRREDVLQPEALGAGHALLGDIQAGARQVRGALWPVGGGRIAVPAS